MKEYDVIVIGSGVGTGIVFKALSAGLKVALVDKGPPGGTCVNVGCVPSKMLIYPADKIVETGELMKLGVHAKITRIDFDAIMGRMKRAVASGRGMLKKEFAAAKSLDYYGLQGRFVGAYTLQAGEERIRGRKIFIASGSRPAVPPVKGIETIEYLTNESVLRLKSRPGSVIVIGGGYIGVEYAHFFAAMGVRVTVLEMTGSLVPGEDPELSALLEQKMKKRMDVHTNTLVLEVGKEGRGAAVLVQDRKGGRKRKLSAERVMVAAGRVSNAGLLDLKTTGVETDERNYIKVDEYLQTSRENIWAVGDAIGKQMFTHAGDKEAELAWHNAGHAEKRKMDFGAVPHAVFTHPPIASVGLTEAQARKNHEVLVGKAKYSDVVAGDTMAEKDGFAKAVVEKATGKILGFHIIGPHAPLLIQEVANVLADKGGAESITGKMHTFPALSEVVPKALANLE